MTSQSSSGNGKPQKKSPNAGPKTAKKAAKKTAKKTAKASSKAGAGRAPRRPFRPAEQHDELPITRTSGRDISL